MHIRQIARIAPLTFTHPADGVKGEAGTTFTAEGAQKVHTVVTLAGPMLPTALIHIWKKREKLHW